MGIYFSFPAEMHQLFSSWRLFHLVPFILIAHFLLQLPIISRLEKPIKQALNFCDHFRFAPFHLEFIFLDHKWLEIQFFPDEVSTIFCTMAAKHLLCGVPWCV